MEIKQDILKKMYAHSYRNMFNNIDKIRALDKSEHYAQEILKIRTLSKRNLVKYISKLKSKKSVKLGYKIAHSSSSKIYRSLDSKIQQDIELINYARNRLYARI